MTDAMTIAVALTCIWRPLSDVWNGNKILVIDFISGVCAIIKEKHLRLRTMRSTG